jgi:ATP-dependent Clp protease protease subunit
MNKSWFVIKNEASAPRAEVFIEGEIGMFGITSQDFRNAFNAIPKGRLIDLRIHSPGGSVIEGMRMYNTVSARRADVTAYIDVEAGSMATVIACGASKIVMPENGWFIIHNVQGAPAGESKDLRRAADRMDVLTEQIVDIYAEKTGKPRAEIQAAMDVETWFTAQAAKDFGFCDEITAPIDIQGKTTFSDRFKNGPKSKTEPAIEPK